MAAAAVAPGLRVTGHSLADLIERNRDAVRNRKYQPIGKMLNLFLGQDDSATYAQNTSVRDHIASMTKVRGLQLDWMQFKAPEIAWSDNYISCVFPYGIDAPPKISDPRIPGVTNKTIAQKLEDHASGWIAGRDGSIFMVLQPILYIGVWPYGVASLFMMLGHADQKKYPALLIDPKKREGHIVHGRLELTNRLSPGSGSI